MLGSTVPYMAWDFTVASAKSLAGPALTMHSLAYKWLADAPRHVRRPGAPATTDFAPSFAVPRSTDNNGVRDVHGTFQVPLFLERHDAVLELVTDRVGNPIINGTKTWTANFICVLPSTVQSCGPGDSDRVRPRPAR